MKIKLDFITNSSSSSFILSLQKKDISEYVKYIKKLDKDKKARNSGVYINIIAEDTEKLNIYTNDNTLDWVQKATKPNFIMMNEKQYDICKQIIKEGNIATQCEVDWNITDIFINHYKDNIIFL